MLKKMHLAFIVFLLMPTISYSNGDELCPGNTTCEDALMGAGFCCIFCCIFLAESNKQELEIYKAKIHNEKFEKNKMIPVVGVLGEDNKKK